MTEFNFNQFTKEIKAKLAKISIQQIEFMRPDVASNSLKKVSQNNYNKSILENGFMRMTKEDQKTFLENCKKDPEMYGIISDLMTKEKNE